MVKNNYNFVGKKSKTNYLKVQRQKRKNTKNNHKNILKFFKNWKKKLKRSYVNNQNTNIAEAKREKKYMKKY